MGQQRTERLGLSDLTPDERREKALEMYREQRAKNETAAELYRVSQRQHPQHPGPLDGKG